jgi:hypothetical protein
MANEHLQGKNKEHKLILTAKPGSNGKVLRVRCKCMAEYRNVSDHYYNYDWIAEVGTVEEVLVVYRKHLEES